MKIIRSEKGQVSIMIGTMMLTFVVFFAFVINTGTLVNAKINLQNAADLAAYAGAGTQARLLNEISFLNYEMREEYKKFLFRYYVIGNTSSGIIPPASGSGQVSWVVNPPSGSPSAQNVPAVCIDIDAKKDNPCHLGVLPHIASVTPASIIDPIAQELAQQTEQIEAIRQTSCGAIADLNQMVLFLWLFNTDPNLTNLTSASTDPGTQTKLRFAQSVAQGIGIVPREFILSERIKSLSTYLNNPALSKVTFSQAQSLKQGQDPAAQERTIQAFLSAYYTLGTNMFAPNTISMDELLPQSDGVFKYTPITTSFDAYFVDYNIQGLGPNGQIIGNTSCIPVVNPITVPGLPVGIVKDPTVMTYYAVRLSAVAKVLFNPFGDLNLTAYSAARPFGSRIGPTADSTYASFSTPQSTPPNVPPGYLPNQPPKAAGQLPNLIETPTGDTWLSANVLSAMYGMMQVSASGTYGPTEIGRGFAAARAPTAVEANIYNVINDDGDPMAKYFDGSLNAAFWAPIVTPDKLSTLKDTLTQDLTALLSQAQPQVIGTKSTKQAGGLTTAIVNALVTYIQTLNSGGGENGEGINMVRIANPLHYQDPTTPYVVPGISVANAQALKSSWDTVNDSTYRAAGRIGYSVKFVSFDSLRKPDSNDANGATSHKNTDFEDATAKQQDFLIKH